MTSHDLVAGYATYTQPEALLAEGAAPGRTLVSPTTVPLPPTTLVPSTIFTPNVP